MIKNCPKIGKGRCQKTVILRRVFFLLIWMLHLLPTSSAIGQKGGADSLDISISASGISLNAEQSVLRPPESEAIRQYLERRLQATSFVTHGGQLKFHLTGPLLHRLQDELSQVDPGNPQQVDRAVDRVLQEYESTPWAGDFDQTQFVIGQINPWSEYPNMRQLVIVGSEGDIDADLDRALIIGSRVNFMNGSHVRQALFTIGSQVTANREALAGAQRMDVLFPPDSKAWFQSLADSGRQFLQRQSNWQAWPAAFYGGMVSLLLAFALGALYLRLFPVFHSQTERLLLEQKGKALGIGVLGYLALMVVLLLLIITLLGILFMPSMLFLFIILNAMGYFTAASAVGHRLLHRYATHDIWKFSAGLLCLQVIGLVPWLGWVIVQLIGMAGFGAVLMSLSHQLRKVAPQRMRRAEIWPRPVSQTKRWKMPSSAR